eukprot:m.447099 g.447099  ORF g.447099 m.447099 type:complete len:428 (+) comp19468_c0_seq1:101-1384(+)
MLPVIAAAFGAYFTTAEPCPWPNTCPGTLPKMKQTWLMNLSTIIMPCNDTGFTDPQSTLGWGIVDFDWSNSKGTGTADGWAKHRPMDDEELLFKQVQMTTAATPGTTVWVYRNTVYGYPWYTDVRKTLEDPAYVPWYFKFKPNGPWYSKKCDSAQPDICSDLYHSQEQTPGYPSGDGNCLAPGCDCGKVPCGFYVWNHSSTAVVNGQTFQDWFIHSYVLNEVGSSPLVSGFFWDDVWNPQCNIHDQVPQTCQDMGLTTDDLIQLTKDYEINMAALRTAVLNMGKFAWQMLWTGGPDDNIGGTGLNPLVQQNGCAATLRRLCNATSPAQTRAMAFGLSTNHRDPSQLTDLKQDLANFLLIRGPYSWLGHGWLGCSKQYFFPPEFNVDYGVPSELCKETAENSGIFTRDFSKSTVQMDCNKWEGTITMK